MEEERKEHEKGEAAAAGGIDEVLGEILHLLEDRLVQHDNNRQEVQSQLDELYAQETGYASSLEEKVNSEVSKDFNLREERILGIIAKLNEGGDGLDAVVTQAKEELCNSTRYCLERLEPAEKSFADSYKLNVVQSKTENDPFNTNDIGALATLLQQHLDKIRESMAAVQNEIAGVCSKRQDEAADMKKRITKKLETLSKEESARIQGVMKEVKLNVGKETGGTKRMITKAKAALVLTQKYVINKPSNEGSLKDLDLVTEKEASPGIIDFDERKPTGLDVSFIKVGGISVSFNYFSEDEFLFLRPFNIMMKVELDVWEKGSSGESNVRKFVNEHKLGDINPIYFGEIFTPITTYLLRMRFECSGMLTQWSDTAEFTTPEFRECCIWKDCPGCVDENRKYTVDEKNLRIATKKDFGWCTIIGNTYLPLNKTTSWSITVLKSEKNNGGGIFVGVAPSDINQNEWNNSEKCGWYFNCYDSSLYSGPPYKNSGKEYGPRKRKDGQYVHTGDSVGVVMDAEKGDLSFALNGVNFGTAYEGIPLDKPLVPCVILRYKRDSVRIDPSSAKVYEVDGSVQVPSNIAAKGDTWNSIALTWDYVGDAELYHIEVDGSNFIETSVINIFTERSLPPETEHSFRVRAVRGSAVSEWSDVVTGKTQKISFITSAWTESSVCTVDYFNPRIVSKVVKNDEWNTVIGNTPFPHNSMVLWSIKLLKPEFEGEGWNIYVGVAPTSINLEHENVFDKCGWYLNCFDSSLWSGPPHNYRGEAAGPKEKDGKHVCTGDSVGAVMDTTERKLSFIVGSKKRVVEIEGIPLDKPLVPCVLLREMDTVEFLPLVFEPLPDQKCIIS